MNSDDARAGGRLIALARELFGFRSHERRGGLGVGARFLRLVRHLPELVLELAALGEVGQRAGEARDLSGRVGLRMHVHGEPALLVLGGAEPRFVLRDRATAVEYLMVARETEVTLVLDHEVHEVVPDRVGDGNAGDARPRGVHVVQPAGGIGGEHDLAQLVEQPRLRIVRVRVRVVGVSRPVTGSVHGQRLFR